MKYLFILIILFSIKASAQSDTTTSLYVQVPKAFVTKYLKYKVFRDGCNRQFNAIQGNDSLYYTSANAIKEFETELQEAGVTKANVINRLKKLHVSDFPQPIQPSAGTLTKTQ